MVLSEADGGGASAEDNQVDYNQVDSLFENVMKKTETRRRQTEED